MREETQNESGKFNLFYGKGIIFSNDFVFDLVLEHSSFSPNRSKVAHSQKSENFDLEDEIWTLEKNIEASNADGDQDISPYLGQTNTIDSRETISSQQNFSDTI